jgi:hypothetical protein
VAGSQFIFDETRNRFVYPQDQTLTVYFEWESTPGDHVLTATWKQPDGRTSVSPDVKIQTTSKELNSFWIFRIDPYIPNGTWTVEIRIDGRPAGSHTFELAGLDPLAGRFTLDRVSKTFGAAIVQIHPVDASGHRLGSMTGFVIAPGAVATAFQSIDMANSVELEFADGAKVVTTELLAWSRLGDWAVLHADTRNIAPVKRGDAKAIPIGSNLAIFNVDGETRVMTTVAVGAVTSPSPYGTRIRFSPAVPLAAFGGPLIDEEGKTVGILGGTLTPGLSRTEAYVLGAPGFRLANTSSMASGAADLPVTFASVGKQLTDLRNENVLTPLLNPMPEFVRGGTTAQLPKDAADLSLVDKTEFSARDDAQMIVYSYWIKKSKLSKGELSAQVFDVANQLRGSIPGKKLSLGDREQRFSVALAPKGMSAGYYRIDICWDGKPVWRTYVRIVE